jgi:hypothetical protein
MPRTPMPRVTRGAAHGPGPFVVVREYSNGFVEVDTGDHKFNLRKTAFVPCPPCSPGRGCGVGARARPRWTTQVAP